MDSSSQRTPRDRLGQHLIVGFAFALLLYLVGFHLIEHFRQVKGPWHVRFQTDARGQPSVSIAHEKLHILNVTFVFSGEHAGHTNLDATVVFDDRKTNVPFGKVLFLDTTFLPGTVTFDFFGHEIELLPRTLAVNLKEVPWRSGATISLTPEDKLRRR